jgi:hypothetical protein
MASAPVVANAVVSLEQKTPGASTEATASTATIVRSTTETATAEAESDGPKLCLIDDPDCEACQ